LRRPVRDRRFRAPRPPARPRGRLAAPAVRDQRPAQLRLDRARAGPPARHPTARVRRPAAGRDRADRARPRPRHGLVRLTGSRAADRSYWHPAMQAVLAACRTALARPGGVRAPTAAGVTAERGIPTSRGRGGYCTVGPREYHPQELAPHEAFEAMPWEVWAWSLYRRSVCRRAEPNPGHHALVRLDAALPDRLALVTPNVDGLHPRPRSPHAPPVPLHRDI